MSDSPLKAPDPQEQACRAHHTVICVPKDNGDGTLTDRWVCRSCNAGFTPDSHALARAERAEAREAELREMLGAIKEAADDCFEDRANRPGDHYTVSVCLFCGSDYAHVPGCLYPDLDAALSSPSPVAEAMARVVEAATAPEFVRFVEESGRRIPMAPDGSGPMTSDDYEDDVAVGHFMIAARALQAARKGEG